MVQMTVSAEPIAFDRLLQGTWITSQRLLRLAEWCRKVQPCWVDVLPQAPAGHGSCSSLSSAAKRCLSLILQAPAVHYSHIKRCCDLLWISTACPGCADGLLQAVATHNSHVAKAATAGKGSPLPLELRWLCSAQQAHQCLTACRASEAAQTWQPLGICFDMWLKSICSLHAHCQKVCSQVDAARKAYLLTSHKRQCFCSACHLQCQR